MLTGFQCDNFRNTSCDKLQFERINILIGPNNAGKSNFIRALSFAANMVSYPQDEKTGFLSELKRNGWNKSINRRVDESEFKLKWTFQLKDRPVEYSLSAHLGERRQDNYISLEALQNESAGEGYSKPFEYFRCHAPQVGRGRFSTAGMSFVKGSRVKADVSQYESVLLQMDTLFFKNMDLFSKPFVRDDIRNVLESMRSYFHRFFACSCTAFNISEIRKLQDEQNDGSYLSKNGENFVNVFYENMLKDEGYKAKFLKMFNRLSSDCEDIKVENAGGKIWMELKFNGCWFSLSEVSDGTIHLLLLLLLLTLPEGEGTTLLAIDEPEMNLHPAWQKVLAKEMMNCQSFKQCFISTHSPDFLDEFTNGFLDGDVAVFVFDPTRNKSIRKLDRILLRDDLENWTLGDLYRIGDPVIGGWPQ